MASTSPYKGTQLLTPTTQTTQSPLIVCFHGAGESCASWWDIAQILVSKSYRVLLYDRGDNNAKPEPVVKDMAKYLSESQFVPPYVLVAHSYGGTFARQFLQLHRAAVTGMVLVETGQETALPAAIENEQYRRQILGDKPLSVIRGNSLIAGYAKFQAQLDAAHSEAQREEIRNCSNFQLLENMDRKDEELKKRQLGLSRNSNYIHLPDCGHHVIRDRPDAVAEQVDWVMARLVVDDENVTGSWLHRVRGILRRR